MSRQWQSHLVSLGGLPLSQYFHLDDARGETFTCQSRQIYSKVEAVGDHGGASSIEIENQQRRQKPNE